MKREEEMIQPPLFSKAEETKVILQVKGVSKQFGQLVAIKDLSFEVNSGEIFGVAGPNGAGKSTLFNLISGVYQGSGDIIFDNLNIHGLRPYQICHKGIARTFQIPVVFPTLTVYRNVEAGVFFGRHGVRIGKEEVDEVIDFIGLRGKESTVAGVVDLYTRKLTMLATAFATKPRILLLDEPMAGLSPAESKHFLELVRRINKESGITIMIIEHLVKVLTEVCERLLVLHYGEKLCIGPPKEVMEDSAVAEVYLR